MGNLGVDAIERILAATGEQHTPPNLDKKKLAAGLETCLRMYIMAVGRRSDRHLKNHIRRLKLIKAAGLRFNRRLAGRCGQPCGVRPCA